MPLYWIPLFLPKRLEITYLYPIGKDGGSKTNRVRISGQQKNQEIGTWCYYPEPRNRVYYFQHEVPPPKLPTCLCGTGRPQASGV